MSDDATNGDADDLSKPPKDLNDYKAWLDRGQLGLAMEGLVNRVTGIVGNEQTAQILVKQLRQEQAQRDEQQATRLEQIVFGLKGDLNTFRGDFQEQLDNRFKARDGDFAELVALVEERTRPLADLPDRQAAVEAGLQEVITRLNDDEQRLNTKRARLDAHDAAIAELQLHRGASIDALWAKMRLWFLLVMVVVVIVNLAIWIF